MAGYACWYNLQQIFSWLAAMGWQVILHTGVTTRSDLLHASCSSPPTIFRQPRSIAGALSGTGRRRPAKLRARPPGGSSAGSFIACCRSRSWGSGTALLPAIPGTIRCSTRRCWQRRIFSPARQMPTNSWIWPRQTAAAWPPANIIRCTSCGRSTAPAPASAQPAAVAALLEYADRRYAGYQRPLFSRRAADG